jgi:hypothetical protein
MMVRREIAKLRRETFIIADGSAQCEAAHILPLWKFKD